MFNIVVLGKPGAGKGTLSKQLQYECGFHTLTPGELYRTEANLKTEFGLKAKAYWADGNLCPNEMTNELIRNTLQNLNSYNIIFDGYPRSLDQAQYLDCIAQIDLILDLYISDEISIKRLLARREKENRPDDTEEIIRQRLNVYHSNNDEIVNYYIRSPDKYKLINADRPREDVLEESKKIITDRQNN
jgi:adenylate kinase